MTDRQTTETSDTSRRLRWLVLVAAVLEACAACHHGPRHGSEQANGGVEAGLGANPSGKPNPSGAGEPGPAQASATAVAGPSWLKHLGQPVRKAQLGRQGGTGSAPATAQSEPMPTRSNAGATFNLTGADLYRYSCQACHGPKGLGAPDEIPSLIQFVEASSAALLTARMKAQDHPVDEAMMRQLAVDGEKAIRDRLHDGGQKMPPFAYLRSDEVDALIAYLRSLAHAPEDEARPQKIREPALRVGELLARGTCHVCHDATGPGNMHLTMMRGVVPSLASFATQYEVDAVVAKVHEGKVGGMMMMQSRNDMPTFPYLTRQEIAAAQSYVAQVQPSAKDRWPPLPPPASASAGSPSSPPPADSAPPPKQGP